MTIVFKFAISWFCFFLVVDKEYRIFKVFAIYILTFILFKKTYTIFLINKPID